jgi:hypothetical protein
MCLHKYLGYTSFTEICRDINFYTCFKNKSLCDTILHLLIDTNVICGARNSAL